MTIRRSTPSASSCLAAVSIRLKENMGDDEEVKRTFIADFAADVRNFMSPFYLTSVVPNFVLSNADGGPYCSALAMGSPFVAVWYRRIVYQLWQRKQSDQICLIDRVECDDNYSLKFYPVTLQRYRLLVRPDLRGRLFPPAAYLNLMPITVQ